MQGLYLWNIGPICLRTNQYEVSTKTEVWYFTSTDWTSEVYKQFITCNSISAWWRISSPTSLYTVTFLFLIGLHTFSLHILWKILIFIRRKRGFFKLKPLNKQYGKYPTAYKPIKMEDPRIRTAHCHGPYNNKQNILWLYILYKNTLTPRKMPPQRPRNFKHYAKTRKISRSRPSIVHLSVARRLKNFDIASFLPI